MLQPRPYKASSTSRGDLPVTFTFLGMNNLDDPQSLDNEKGICANITNMDCRTNDISTRKGYKEILLGNFHSGWSNGDVAYAVSDGYLVSFDGTIKTNLYAVNNNLKMVFEQVNNLIVATNGQQYLIIENNTVTEATGSTLQFKVKPPAGTFLTLHFGRLYIAINNVLVCTDPYSVDVCDEREMYIPITNDRITGILAVDDGIYIGTETEAFFLKTMDPYGDGGMQLIPITTFGCVYGSMQQTFSSKVKIIKGTGKMAVWLSKYYGICVGGNGGAFTNISSDSVVIPEVNHSNAVIREVDGIVHYVVITGDGAYYNKYEALNLEITESQL